MSKRFDRCVCGDTFGKHDDNGVCRVKFCDCVSFELDLNEKPSSFDEPVTHRSYHGA